MIANRILVELLEFLRRHEFLYGRLNVEFFSARMYEQIDKQWLDFMVSLPFEQLQKLPIYFATFPECPASLRQFFTDAQRLSLLNKYCTKFLPISTSKTTQREEQICTKMRRVNPKKMHELSALNELCLAECERMGVDRIVDIGSGLGHFGRFLKHNNGSQQIEYVGIEADPVLCHSGRKICEDIQLENIFFGQPETAERCRHILSNGARTGIISLHGCGHLQRLIMKEFVELAKANPEKNPLLLTIGCCYHKVANWDDRTVERWMMSQSMLAAFKQVYGTSGFPIPGLRLAAQAKMSRWLDLSEKKRREHRRSFSNRAFVECVRTEIFGESNGRPRSLNRKLGDCPDEFREEVLRRSECPPEKRQHYEQLLDNAMREHSHAMAYIEPFAALQFALQAPLEALVQLDKLLYLREQGFDAEMVELFDPDISPRNMCIVARIKDS